MSNIYFFNPVFELIFPYSIAEGGKNCVPMYSNKCSEIEKKNHLTRKILTYEKRDGFYGGING
jgi:hypothetical protein